MYWPPPGIKRHPERRWNRPDRIFFGHGACHILAGAYLRLFPQTNLQPERITPKVGRNAIPGGRPTLRQSNSISSIPANSTPARCLGPTSILAMRLLVPTCF